MEETEFRIQEDSRDFKQTRTDESYLTKVAILVSLMQICLKHQHHYQIKQVLAETQDTTQLGVKKCSDAPVINPSETHCSWVRLKVKLPLERLMGKIFFPRPPQRQQH